MKARSLVDTLLSQAGKLYLRLHLRNRDVIERELTTKYEGHYRNVGLMLLFDLLMALAVATVVILTALALYFVTASSIIY